MQDEIERIRDEYRQNVKWLRVHVAPDDIYDFAQQAIMASEYLIRKLSAHIDVADECEDDSVLNIWVMNLVSIARMKNNGFDGMIDTAWRVE